MIPEKMDHYQIMRELGRGGMAIVYLAYELRFNRDLAIKVFPRQFTSDVNYASRFEDYARAIAALEHRFIVLVHD